MRIYELGKFIANTLNDSDDYKSYCSDTIGATFDYYLNVDLNRVEIMLPYFSIVAYNNTQTADENITFDVQFLVGIERYTNSKDEAITEEVSSEKLELVILKAIDIIMNEIRTTGVNGETNIQLMHKNFYLVPPDGEIDIQMQVDLVFEQERFLCH